MKIAEDQHLHHVKIKSTLNLSASRKFDSNSKVPKIFVSVKITFNIRRRNGYHSETSKGTHLRIDHELLLENSVFKKRNYVKSNLRSGHVGFNNEFNHFGHVGQNIN